MTCYDSDNLPPGLVPSGLPGNSPKEIAVERAVEKADYEIGNLAVELQHVAARLEDAFGDGPDEAQRNIKKASYRLEEIQAKLDDARSILGQALDD